MPPKGTPFETGRWFTDATTATHASIPVPQRAVKLETDDPLRTHIENWFIKPLSAFDGHEAFVCLMVALPLLEKFVRYKTKEKPNGKFSAKSELLKNLTKLLGYKSMHENEVHIFWRMFRNGMLHRGMPAKVGGWTWEFETGKASPIRWDNNHLFVDPWCFRDLVLKLLNDNKKAWADHLFPIAKVYVESKK